MRLKDIIPLTKCDQINKKADLESDERMIWSLLSSKELFYYYVVILFILLDFSQNIISPYKSLEWIHFIQPFSSMFNTQTLLTTLKFVSKLTGVV